MEIRKILVVLMVIVGVVVTACTTNNSTPVPHPTEAIPQTPATTIPTQPEPTAAPTRPGPEVPGENATYFIEGQSVILVNGMAETELAPGSASKQVTRYFGNAVEMDLNADGLIDTAFLLYQDAGGSGSFYYVVAALNMEAGYAGTNAIFLGDRIAPQSTNVDPNDASQFIVNYANRNPEEPMAAQPSIGVSRTFKVDNGTLVEVTVSP